MAQPLYGLDDLTTKEGIKAAKEALKDEFVETSFSTVINGVPIDYKATAGTLIVKDDAGNPKASFFFISYTKEKVSDTSTRPITYCFNGGPGSCSVWLNLGVFGPKRADIDEQNAGAPPYSLVDNQYSILDVTDLVFIDPVSTGFSRPAPGEDAKQFHGLEEDIKSVGDFILQYTTKFQRWNSPKFMAGESYGTTRAAGLVDELDKEHFMVFNGIIMVSSGLNHQTLWDFQGGNDLPYILYLPSYTATAWYHKKLSAELQKDLQQSINESEAFAQSEYMYALMLGDRLSQADKEKMAEKLSRFTGLSKEYLIRSNLRVSVTYFTQELLKNELKSIGRFDGRIVGIDYDPMSNQMTWDPSVQYVTGGFTALINQYIRKDLKWEKSGTYKIFGDVWPWNYGKANNQYVNIAVPLSEVMSRNPRLKVFVASGIYDLATPFFAADYTFDHLDLVPSIKGNVIIKKYPAGHMMYLHKPTLPVFTEDVRNFIKKSYKANN